MSAPKPVAKWEVDDVVAWLGSIGLEHLADAFKTNAVNGSDLIGLTDEDMKDSLGCSGLQIKKIKKELSTNWGVASMATAAESGPIPAVQAPAPVVAAPAAAPVPAPEATKSQAPDGEDKAAKLQALQAKAAQAQQAAVSYSRGQQYLHKAEDELKRALQALTVTQASGVTETIQDVRIGVRGGGMFGRNRQAGNRLDRRNDFAHNAIEMGTVHKAQALVKEAGQNIQMAQQAVPNLPFIQPARVQQAMSGVFFNVFAQGLVGDMMQNAKVKQAKDSVHGMHQEVVQALDWCTNNMNAAQAEAASLNGMVMASA